MCTVTVTVGKHSVPTPRGIEEVLASHLRDAGIDCHVVAKQGAAIPLATQPGVRLKRFTNGVVVSAQPAGSSLHFEYHLTFKGTPQEEAWSKLYALDVARRGGAEADPSGAPTTSSASRPGAAWIAAGENALYVLLAISECCDETGCCERTTLTAVLPQQFRDFLPNGRSAEEALQELLSRGYLTTNGSEGRLSLSDPAREVLGLPPLPGSDRDRAQHVAQVQDALYLVAIKQLRARAQLARDTAAAREQLLAQLPAIDAQLQDLEVERTTQEGIASGPAADALQRLTQLDEILRTSPRLSEAAVREASPAELNAQRRVNRPKHVASALAGIVRLLGEARRSHEASVRAATLVSEIGILRGHREELTAQIAQCEQQLQDPEVAEAAERLARVELLLGLSAGVEPDPLLQRTADPLPPLRSEDVPLAS